MCMYVNEIVDVVNDLLREETMFTAWDVTCVLRKKVKQKVQHYEVKREVHQMFEQGDFPGYARALANLPNINPQPWIYYPPSLDPNDYKGKPVTASGVAAMPAVAALPAPTASMSSVDDDTDTDIAADGSVVYKFDTTDRLCVPNKLVRDLGLKEGDEVEVVACATIPTEVCVVPKGGVYPGQPPHVSSSVAKLTVDRYDNVRIGRTTLNKVGLNGVAFEIERDGSNPAIKVKKYA